MTQTEKPGVTPEQLVVCFGHAPGSVPLPKVSGGQFENFRKGWAHAVFANSLASHWFVRDGFDKARALCGAQAQVRWLYGPGNYPRCGNCIKTMSRMIKRGEL